MHRSNNPRAAIATASVSAVSFGIGGLYLLYVNGIVMGSLAHEMKNVHKLPDLIIWTLAARSDRTQRPLSLDRRRFRPRLGR